MTKPSFLFYFADEPQFATVASRAWVANSLRAYRRQPGKFRVYRTAARVGAGCYTIHSVGSTAVGIITRRPS